MAIPKIEFKYSWPYDDHWRAFYKKDKDYPDYKEIEKHILKIKKEWQKDEEKILKELSKVSGLKWQEKSVTCFVVGRCVPFSYPLTMPFYRKYPIDYTIDVLTHELVHQLFIQGDNEKQSDAAWKYFFRKYKKEEYNAIIHIPVHALHHHIFMKFFGEERLNREIKFMSEFPDYKRSWDIVLEKGAENIIEEFRKRVG